jgi:hypothetical protein
MQRPGIIDSSYVQEHETPESWKLMNEDKVLILMPSPCNMIISSPTNGGKSTFVYRLLKHDMFQMTPEKILYCYNSTWQPLFSQLEVEIPGITFHHGLPAEQELEEFKASTAGHKLIILDDLMTESTASDSILRHATISMHHECCSMMLLTHNLFPKSKHARTLTLNTQVFVVMANSRDHQQIQLLGRQTGYKNLLDAYLLATKEPFNHFVIDLDARTPRHLKLRSGIFPDDDGTPTTIYKAQ